MLKVLYLSNCGMDSEKHPKPYSCDWQSQGQGFDSPNLHT